MSTNNNYKSDLDGTLLWHHVSSVVEAVQNTTIEERVSLLEIQVADLDQDVNFLFDEQIIQDQRLFSLEQGTDEINVQLVNIDDELEGTFLSFTALCKNICSSRPFYSRHPS